MTEDRFAVIEAQYDLESWLPIDDQIQLDLLFGPGVRRAVAIEAADVIADKADLRAMALAALKDGEPLKRVARRLGIAASTVRAWRDTPDATLSRRGIWIRE